MKGGERMSNENGRKRGRPTLEDPRVNRISLRMSSEELAKLEELCKKTGKRKSDILRISVENTLKAFEKEN